MHGFPLSDFMHSTEAFLSDVLGSVPCSAWHREGGVTTWGPWFGWCHWLVVSLLCFSSQQTNRWFDLASVRVGKPSANTMPMDKGSSSEQQSKRGASCGSAFVPLLYWGPGSQLPARFPLRHKPEVMVRGEGTGCVCPLTKSRSEAHVSQRAAALLPQQYVPVPAARRGHLSEQQAHRNTETWYLHWMVEVTREILRLQASLSIQPHAQLNVLKTRLSHPHCRPLTDKIQPSPQLQPAVPRSASAVGAACVVPDQQMLGTGQ